MKEADFSVEHRAVRRSTGYEHAGWWRPLRPRPGYDWMGIRSHRLVPQHGTWWQHPARGVGHVPPIGRPDRHGHAIGTPGSGRRCWFGSADRTHSNLPDGSTRWGVPVQFQKSSYGTRGRAGPDRVEFWLRRYSPMMGNSVRCPGLVHIAHHLSRRSPITATARIRGRLRVPTGHKTRLGDPRSSNRRPCDSFDPRVGWSVRLVAGLGVRTQRRSSGQTADERTSLGESGGMPTVPRAFGATARGTPRQQ